MGKPKNISNFKSQTLHMIASIYQLAGLAINKSPFIMGFGNRVTDARAYQSAGIDSACIFVLNSSSEVSLWSHNTSWSHEMGDVDSGLKNVPKLQQGVYTGYGDLNLKGYVSCIINQQAGIVEAEVVPM